MKRHIPVQDMNDPINPDPDHVEQLLLLLNDIHVGLEMMAQLTTANSDPHLEAVVNEIKIQELVILAKLAELQESFGRG